MSEQTAEARAALDAIRVPANLRSVIVQHKLARNDIAVLLLVLERTLSNVFPPMPVTALSIRYIAEQNGCSPKGAENSVRKLKELGLIVHETSPGLMRTGTVGLNCEKFIVSQPEIVSGESGRALPAARTDHTLERARVEADLLAVRDLLHAYVNGGRIVREADLPAPFLAVLFLDHFGMVEAVEEYLKKIHADAKRRGFPIRGYGYYHDRIRSLRDSALLNRYLDSIRVTEPMDAHSLPEPLPGIRAHQRIRQAVEDWILS